jgi:hypothetical protein
VDDKSRAALNAFTKSVYAMLEDVVPGAITLPPTVVPGGKPVIVPETEPTPTLPMTTDVPVFEIVPPRSGKEVAVPRLTEIGPPKAGTTAATAITNQINFLSTFRY